MKHILLSLFAVVALFGCTKKETSHIASIVVNKTELNNDTVSFLIPQTRIYTATATNYIHFTLNLVDAVAGTSATIITPISNINQVSINTDAVLVYTTSPSQILPEHTHLSFKITYLGYSNSKNYYSLEIFSY